MPHRRDWLTRFYEAMSSSNVGAEIDECWGNAAVEEAVRPPPAADKPAALLRGSAKGLEIVLDGQASLDAIATALTARLAEAPAFFRGSDVRIRVDDGPLAPGSLTRLDAIAGQFELRIVEIGALAKRAADDAVPRPNLASGSGVSSLDLSTADSPQASLPLVEPPTASSSEPAPITPEAPVTEPQSHPDQLELALHALELEPEIEVVIEEPASPDTRIVLGPVRSGVILEHRGHLIVFGDVNPGAEIRAEGNIVVLGRLRGTAHAGIGRDAGFILALRLEPQQLRIDRLVARASDQETPGQVPEIAHVTGGTIIVERYLGRLPGSLAASI